ncbi:paraneoplastic antigen Ma1 homolog [Clarias gariepinus]|uniref:paraneoplastic antigen Ma1 homolog n=1 Tax=Clarias gariepinus TaxID=13013 RepID=UPI00234C8EC1|nr:paraneoplastic antigen Ma1 homolog [Clarias gariepinus]
MADLAVRSELLNELREWCEGESLNKAYSLLVLVPKGFEVAEIEATIETVKVFGRVRVRGRRFSPNLNREKVLCESKQPVDVKRVPLEVMHASTKMAWPVISALERPEVDEKPPPPLKHLLDASSSNASAESIIRAVGDLLSTIERPYPSGESGSYRRLRVFSGTIPTPIGEEGLEPWLEQAHLMVEESGCSPREKRRRIMESLRGQALALVKAVRTADADVSPLKVLEVIESSFGTVESGEDLYFELRLMQQGPKENLSDFLR